MGIKDYEQLWDKKDQILSLEVPCKGRVGSPRALLPVKDPNQCWQPAPSLWDKTYLKDFVPDAELHGVSHAWTV